MITQLIGDIYDANQSQIRDVVMNDGMIYTVTAQPAYRSYSALTLAPSASGSGIVANPSGIALVNAGSAIITSSSANQVDWVQLSTGSRAGVTSGAATTMYGTAGGQVDINTSTGYALATKSTTGSVTLINAISFTCSSMTVTPLSGQNATCVRTKDSNFLIGTTDHKVHELSIAGSLIKSLTLPSTPAVTAPTSLRVASISYYNGYALIANTAGFIFLYDWSQSTPTLLDTFFISGWDLNNNPVLSVSASGSCILTGMKAMTQGQSQACHQIYFEKGEICVQDSFFNNRRSGYNGNCQDVVQNYFGIWTSDTTTGTPLRIFKQSGNNKVNVPSRVQDPPLTDISARIIRIRDGGVGKCCVESDTNIGSVETQISATDNTDYIEIALATSPNRQGFRVFTA